MLPPDPTGERVHPAAGRSPASTAEHLSRTAWNDASAGPGTASDASGPTGADRPLPKITLEKKNIIIRKAIYVSVSRRKSAALSLSPAGWHWGRENWKATERRITKPKLPAEN